MKKIAIFILTAVISAFVCLSSGCAYSALKNLSGTYNLDFNMSEVGEAIDNGTVTIDGSKAYVSIKYNDSYLAKNEKPELLSGNYKVEYSYYIYESITGYLISENGSRFIFGTDGNYFFFDYVYLNIAEHYKNCQIYFLKSGAPADFEGTKPSGNTGNKPNQGTTSPSRFNEIKSAYSSAGYNTNLDDDGSIDASTKQLINTMKTLYGQLGYNLCFIGKDMNNLLNAEMYMLIGATPQAVEELAQGFEGAYKYKKKGSDIIVYIWTLGTPNFTPFDNAVN